jgi:hypothetical protein
MGSRGESATRVFALDEPGIHETKRCAKRAVGRIGAEGVIRLFASATGNAALQFLRVQINTPMYRTWGSTAQSARPVIAIWSGKAVLPRWRDAGHGGLRLPPSLQKLRRTGRLKSAYRPRHFVRKPRHPLTRPPQLICPSGVFREGLSSPLCKNILVFRSPKSLYIQPVSSH